MIKNSLLSVNPKLANEWDYKKNEDLTPKNITYGSNKKVWWKCKKGHSWKAQIGRRNKKNGYCKCPICRKLKN